MAKVSSGAEIIDAMLDGGYETDIITTIYGPSGSGKTNLCLIAAIAALTRGKKVVFVDTEGGISVERLQQLCSKELLENCLFLRPTSFEEQKASIERLKSLITDSIGMVVVDTMTMLYRVERGQSYDPYETDNDLGRQIASLAEIARVRTIPVIVTNQVYDNFKEEGVKMVGGNLLQYYAKCLIELKKGMGNKRIAVLKKHRSLGEGRECRFEIVNEGIKKA